ncbi:putative phosphothreonine lyase domain-containing protein [Paraburkholderia dilworthii]|uniref:putative phosphothreonine lyase domain-containing protein n=1 Tax=Paraburkholderia dilworthii TaxID=948106 RepID=UPI0006879BC4|nr:putative phosphothreonine lyase domain-containg protein [Paraburkholderia dilworthii]
MKEGISVEERLSRKQDKPSEDLSCNWHYKKSPSYSDFASTDLSGEWCIFVSPTDMDDAWSKISSAIEAEQLIFAKVSTALRSMGRDGHVICVYTRDWADRQDLMRARKVLQSLGFVKELGYKRDIDTRNRIYGSGESYLRA